MQSYASGIALSPGRVFFILDFVQSRVRRGNGIKNLPRLETEVCMLFDSLEKIQ